MESEETTDYVYILAASHSGSTLMALLLNSHPAVATIGETSSGNFGDTSTYRCSCGRPIGECSFWARIVETMQVRHPEFRLGSFGTRFEYPSSAIIDRFLRLEQRGRLCEYCRDVALRMAPGWRRLEKGIGERCFDLAATVLATAGARVFVDSSKVAHRLKFLLRVAGLNIRVIHLVRDGRGVALTYMNQDEFGDARTPLLRRGGRGPAGQATAPSLPMRRAADEWRRCLRSAEHVLSTMERSKWIQIHYEELCRDPNATLNQIFAFLDLDPDKRVEDFRSVENHIIGNGMRLDSTSEVRLDERWREHLTEVDLQVFDTVAGEMNRQYGYA